MCGFTWEWSSSFVLLCQFFFVRTLLCQFLTHKEGFGDGCEEKGGEKLKGLMRRREGKRERGRKGGREGGREGKEYGEGSQSSVFCCIFEYRKGLIGGGTDEKYGK